MATYAVINNGTVTNTIIAESKEVAETVTGLTCIEYTESNAPGIGYSYDGSSFSAPSN